MTDHLYNLHNHTPFSDGAYTIDELCEAHLDLKDVEVDGIGISDSLFQTPTSREPSDDRDFQRLFAAETRSYVASVLEARQRWDGRLRIFCGAEISWPLNKRNLSAIRNMLTGIDYVMFINVDWAGLTQLANQARRWPCPVGLAQCDVSTRFPNTSHDQIVRTMANARLFYEINSVFLPLSERDAWYKTLSEHRVRVALGTDTHDDLSCLKMLPELYQYTCRRGLDAKLIEPCNREQQQQQQALSA